MIVPIYEVTMDSKDELNPIKRVTLKVEGLLRSEAVLLAKEYMIKTGFVYEVAFVIAGHKQETT